MLKNLSLTLALAGAALISAAPARALSVQFNGGSSSLQGTTIFQDFDSAPLGVFGGGNGVFAASISGVAARPAFDSTGNFLGVQAGNTSSITLGIPNVQVLSFVIGSLDGYNTVVLNFLSGPSRILSGLEIITGNPADSGLPGTGNQTATTTNGRVFYDTQGLDSIVSFSLSSTSNAFEIDNVSTAVPEPATWGMMILAAGMAGTALRRRRNRGAMA